MTLSTNALTVLITFEKISLSPLQEENLFLLHIKYMYDHCSKYQEIDWIPQKLPHFSKVAVTASTLNKHVQTFLIIILLLFNSFILCVPKTLALLVLNYKWNRFFFFTMTCAQLQFQFIHANRCDWSPLIFIAV